MPAPVFRAPKGTRDLLAPESERARALVDVFASLAGRAGFELVVPPMFENLAVFSRLGESTDLVSKEMYAFETKGGDQLALRPEQTASVVRMFVQHHPPTPWKAWYAGPNFRYERPQAGRYRQFDQVGVEVLGSADPDIDVEVVTLASRFFDALGLRRVTLLMNSLGDPDDRRRYAEVLRAHFEANRDALSPQSQATLAHNPLRVLDSKRPEDADLIAGAPLSTNHLSDEASAHFERVKAGLDSLGVPYQLAPRLVRGLDYYTRTTFEFAAEALDTAQNAVGGGGRYDRLAEDLGGKPAPGIGFALGVDRTLLACDAEDTFPAPPTPVDVFVVDTTGGEHARDLTDELRQAGIGADRAYDAPSMKAQMKRADASGARLAIIIGEREAGERMTTVRDLRSGDQETVARGVIEDHVRKVLRR